MARYLNAKDAATYLGSTLPALYQKVYRREVPYIKKGKSLRFDRVALDAWMAADRHEPLHQ